MIKTSFPGDKGMQALQAISKRTAHPVAVLRGGLGGQCPPPPSFAHCPPPPPTFLFALPDFFNCRLVPITV